MSDSWILLSETRLISIVNFDSTKIIDRRIYCSLLFYRTCIFDKMIIISFLPTYHWWVIRILVSGINSKRKVSFSAFNFVTTNKVIGSLVTVNTFLLYRHNLFFRLSSLNKFILNGIFDLFGENLNWIPFELWLYKALCIQYRSVSFNQSKWKIRTSKRELVMIICICVNSKFEFTKWCRRTQWLGPLYGTKTNILYPFAISLLRWINIESREWIID